MMRKNLVSWLAPSLCAASFCAAFASDVCPHWISVMPLDSSDAEAIASDAALQGERTIIDGIAWCCSIHPQGNPAADVAAAYAKSYEKLVPLVRTKSGVKQGVLLQSTMGHGGFPGECTPWQLAVKPDGTSRYRMCPLDPRFLDYIAKSCRTFASLRPDFFMVDDDTRLVMGEVPGCFCPLHLAEFAKRTGRSWTREEVVSAIKSGDETVLAAWEKLKFDSLAAFFRLIRESFPPEIPGMLCVVKSRPHLAHAKEFAEMLASPGQTPVVRANGANYCGNDIYHVFCSRAEWADQLRVIGPGVVCLQEADTCPQTLWSCSATREVENIVIQALEGVKGAKIWITRLEMTKERGSQRRYIRAFSDARGIMEWAAKVDFRQRGAVVPYGRMAQGFAERYLAFMGIAYRYGKAGKGDVTALCVDSLAEMTRDEIVAALSGPLLLDGSAALWLAGNGFSDYIGVKAKPWARRTVQSHVDIDGNEIGPFRVDALVADLADVDPSARELSQFRNRPYMGAESEYEAPGAVEFANSLGGRVITFALPLRSNRPAYYDAAMFAEGYKNWIVGLLSRLCGGVPGGVCFAGAGAVMCEAGETDGDGSVFVLDPFDVDDLIDPEMLFERRPVRIERLGGDGVWREIAFSHEHSGRIRMATTVKAKTPAVFRYRKERCIQ